MAKMNLIVIKPMSTNVRGDPIMCFFVTVFLECQFELYFAEYLFEVCTSCSSG